MRAMPKKTERKDSFAGGLGILLTVGYVCIRALKQVDAHLKEKAERKK